jgi:uncharacterized protein YndB with AHSA1/START domain
MLKKIAIAVVVVVAGVLGYAATRPDTFRVERSATVKAPPEKIYPLISDFHAWTGWSPWERMDPAMKRTYGGAPSGVGAEYAWEGDKNVGKGRMRIVEAAPPSRVVVQLDFEKPFAGHSVAQFTLSAAEDGTAVTWAMRGENRFVGKLISVFMSMDRMIGDQFETGLANLKALVEKA